MAKQDKIKQAVILAGGRGMRLMPLTNDRPKPMVLVNGRPFLEYLLELLNNNGVEEVVLLLGYMPEKIIEHFGNGSKFGIKIRYSISGVEDDTGVRLKKAKTMLNESFVLMYGDNYWPLNLEKMLHFHESKKSLVTMAVYNNKDGGGEYGFKSNLSISDDDKVTEYLDGYSEDQNYNAIDVGTFLFSKKILDFLPENNVSFQKTVLPKLVAQGQLFAYRIDHPYYAITDAGRIPIVEFFFQPKKVVFLDRDGVINKKKPPHDYVKNANEFEFLPGAITAIKKLKSLNYKIFIITNQAGVARGLMSEYDLQQIHEYMSAELARSGAKIDGIYFCQHGYNDGCDCRKPNPGLFYRAARDHFLDLTKATYVGDSKSDALVASRIGCKFELVSKKRQLRHIVNELT